jgi:hypothetical protein
MKRRSFLAASAVALLGGCTFGIGDETPTRTSTRTATPVSSTDSTPSPTPVSEPDERSPEERLRAADSLVEFETADLTATMLDGGEGHVTADGLLTRHALVEPPTAESPAVVWATIRNTRDYEQTFYPGRLPGFGSTPAGRRVGSQDPRVFAILAPTKQHDGIGYSVAVTRDEAGRWRLGVRTVDGFGGRLTLAPGETYFGEYHLVGPYDTEMPPIIRGRYDFGVDSYGFAISVWPTETPGPVEASTFENPDVPPLPVDGPTEWFHEAGEDTGVYLSPSAEQVSAPARVEYELQNRSKTTLDGKSNRWGLYKLESGVWHYVFTLGYPHTPSGLQPGETDRWRLGLYNGDAVKCDDYRAVGHLGGGRYAFHVGSSYDGEVHGALLDVEAPPVSPEPTEAVDIEYDGDEVIVTTPHWDGGDGWHDKRFVFERTDAEPDRRLIPEQLYRPKLLGYRNSLPLFEDGVERVRLRVAGDDVAGYNVLKNEPKAVAYRDETVRVEWEGAPQE